MAKIIAELCQNHSGSREILSQMIKEAAAAGATYVKGQIIFSEDLTFRPRFEDGAMAEDGAIKTIKRPYQAEFERLKKLDLTEDDYKWFVEEAVKNRVIPLFTIFARKRIEFADKLPLPLKIVKVASYDCANIPIIKELCDVFDHLIISVGATTDDEIAKTAEVIKSKGKSFTFLHCVTSYPNALSMCNLARMKWLRRFTDSVGWSDHTLVKLDGLKASKVATMLGADIIERHFTILKEDQTKDGPVSVNPQQLHELVEFGRLSNQQQKEIINNENPDWQIMVGDEKRDLTHTEMLNRDYYRGRFASKINDEWIYNWEDKKIN